MGFLVKVCGLNDRDGVEAALAAGADLLGFVFYERSPRHVSPATARALAVGIDARARTVALTVDADDAALTKICETFDPDLLQLHGRETPERVAEVAARFGRPVIRALLVAKASDLASVDAYGEVADYLLFDARPPVSADRPGGHGAPFDWTILADLRTSHPWFLAGGLTVGNVEEAIGMTGAHGVDVSSGVESRPGLKDPAKIATFVARARRAAALGMAPAIE